MTDLPWEWRRPKLKYVFTLMRAGSSITADAISAEALFPVYGGNGLRGYTGQPTHKGTHVLIGRQGALCGNVHLVDGEFWASEHAIVCSPRPEFDPRFVTYSLSTLNLGQYSQATAQPGIGISDIGGIEVMVPDLIGQNVIADFLDRETAGIDAFIADEERLIELLVERRATVAERYIWPTTGVDAAVLAVTLPSLPSSWRMVRNKNLFRERHDISVDGGEEMLSVSHLTGVTPRSEKNVTMFEAESTAGYPLVFPGDLVINTMWAWMGAAGVAKDYGIVSPAYGIYEPITTDYVPRFYDYLIRTRRYIDAMTAMSRGIRSSRLRLYPEVFLAMPIPHPPVAEQQTIVQRIGEETDWLESAIADARRAIELSRERRAALITAAVTGQIDVMTGHSRNVGGSGQNDSIASPRGQ